MADPVTPAPDGVGNVPPVPAVVTQPTPDGQGVTLTNKEWNDFRREQRTKFDALEARLAGPPAKAEKPAKVDAEDALARLTAELSAERSARTLSEALADAGASLTAKQRGIVRQLYGSKPDGVDVGEWLRDTLETIGAGKSAAITVTPAAIPPRGVTDTGAIAAPRSGPPSPDQLTQADVDRMTPAEKAAFRAVQRAKNAQASHPLLGLRQQK